MGGASVEVAPFVTDCPEAHLQKEAGLLSRATTGPVKHREAEGKKTRCHGEQPTASDRVSIGTRGLLMPVCAVLLKLPIGVARNSDPTRCAARPFECALGESSGKEHLSGENPVVLWVYLEDLRDPGRIPHPRELHDDRDRFREHGGEHRHAWRSQLGELTQRISGTVSFDTDDRAATVGQDRFPDVPGEVLNEVVDDAPVRSKPWQGVQEPLRMRPGHGRGSKTGRVGEQLRKGQLEVALDNDHPVVVVAH
jgi:hypothetical protein